MMNSFEVALYLTALLLLLFIWIRRRVGKGTSISVLVLLLLLMFSAGFFIDIQNLNFWGAVGIRNMSLFFFLLASTAIPWLCFDKWFKKRPMIVVTDKGAAFFEIVFRIVIVSCLFSYIYIFPYAIRSFSLGAAEIRGSLGSSSVLPESIFTTFAVAIATLSPYYVFFFFLSWLHPRLKKYSIWLFISSFVYIVASMPFMARDGFVTLPVFFLIFYFLFKGSFLKQEKKKIKRYFLVVLVLAGTMITIYSISRFYFEGNNSASLTFIGGTWGYLYQQPYVFDRTILYQQNWHGVRLRFPILSFLYEQPIMKLERSQDFETMFGTMLSEFYSIGGYWSLFVFTGAFILIYHWGLRINIRRGNVFSVFMLFITYLIIEVTGLFYFRYGGISFNWLFLILTLLPLFLPNNIIIRTKENE